MGVLDFSNEPPEHYSRDQFTNEQLTPVICLDDGINSVTSVHRIPRLNVPDEVYQPKHASYGYVDVCHKSYSGNCYLGSECPVRIHVFAPLVEPKASVIFLHGMNEMAARYVHFYDRLLQAGIALLVPDQPGHGVSDGFGGVMYDNRQWQLTTLLAHRIRLARFPNAVPFLFGHSLGGLTAFHVSRLFPEVRTGGVILSAPAIMLTRFSMPPLRAFFLNLIPERIRVMVTLPRIPVAKLVSDRSQADKAISFHPLMSATSIQTARTMTVAGHTAMRAINNRAKALADGSNEPSDGEGGCPSGIGSRVFIIHGGQDPCCNWHGAWNLIRCCGGPQWTNNPSFHTYNDPTEAVSDLIHETSPSKLPSATSSPPEHIDANSRAHADRVWLFYPGYSHELLREPEWADMADGVSSWILEKCSRPGFAEDAIRQSRESDLLPPVTSSWTQWIAKQTPLKETQSRIFLFSKKLFECLR